MKIIVYDRDTGDREFTYLDEYIEKNIDSYEDKLGFLIESYSKLIEVLVYYKKIDLDDLKDILFVSNNVRIINEDW